MPQRYGFYTSGGQRALSGIFEGAGEALQAYTSDRLRQRQMDRESKRALVKDAIDKVAGGQWEPGQAENALAAQGVVPPKGYFDSLQPSIESRLSKALAPVGSATSAANFPTEEQTNIGLRANRLNPIAGPGNFAAFEEPGSFEETNPDAAAAYFAKQAALRGAIAPEKTSEGMQGEGASAQPTQTFEQFVPSILGGNNAFDNPQVRATGPTAGQAGAAEGAKAEAAAPGQASAQSQIESLTRGEKIETERQMTRARLQQEYSPDMIALRTRLATQEENARLEAQASRVNWQGGRAETDSGLPYVNLDKFAPQDQRFAAEAAVKNGVPVVRTPEADLLRQIDMVQAGLDEVATLIPRLPKDVVGLPLVELQRRAQSDPRLSGVLSALQPAALGTARVMAGTTGFRSNRIEMERAIDAYLNATTAENKAVQLSTIQGLLRKEESLHLLPNAADRVTYLKSKAQPAPIPLQPGQRSYRVGRQTLIFNRDGSLAGSVEPK